jgi:salicylate hydroxylase
MASDGVLVVGAGIGGLTAALALARKGIAVALFDQAERLEEAGAGIQLSPNATRILVALGLAGRLAPAIVVPAAIRLRAGRTGRDIATIPLGAVAQERYGAPYWVVHRADLQQALLAAVATEPRITLTLGTKVERFTVDGGGVHAKVVGFPAPSGAALIGADGLWSGLWAQLGNSAPPLFPGRTAWRALMPAAELPPADADAIVNLWLGAGGHIVHYPVRGGAAVNIVAVAADPSSNTTSSTGWTTAATRDDVLARFPAAEWAAAARELLSTPPQWQKWPLCERAPSPLWGRGPVTLLGDAAHPMLPFLAQGAAMAIEDAAVLADAWDPVDPAAALRRYERARQPRTAQVQRAARRNDLRYHLGAPASLVRDAVLRVLGGERLLAQYDWIYRWRPEDALAPSRR